MKLTALTLAGAMTLSLGACGESSSNGGGADGGTTEISVWSGFTENDGKVVQAIADEFNKSQDKYKVTIEQNPWNVINDKLLSAISAKNGPDVLTYGPDTAKGFIDQGAFVSVDDFYADSSNETDVYRENVVEGGEVDGTHYGVPMGHAPYSVYFNKAIFDKAGITEDQYPKTWEDLAELAAKLTVDENGDGTPEQYGIALADKDAGYLPTFLQAAGTDLVVDGKANLDSDVAKETLTWIRDNFYAKKSSPTNLSLVDGQSLFISGKAAMFWIGPWIVNTAKEKGIETGTFEMPKGPKEQVTQAASTYWYATSQIDGDEAKTAAAYAWMKYFNSKDNQIKWALEANYPANRTDITEDEIKDNALIAQINPYMDKTKLMLGSVPTGFADVQSELNALGPKLSASTGDISAMLKASNDKIQGYIEQ
ncbi:ABC transporter substrate-binding protein [Bifidobacterium simiiventris]|uniref:ABC transporter substrate-binding protein n=1 Tax=Bifidobacterium simiiventris TaxID=2834434 RepID=UPI001C5694E7|nr:ABC transporter substrate-binding protein [Bifidobacterium simiiventris]